MQLVKAIEREHDPHLSAATLEANSARSKRPCASSWRPMAWDRPPRVATDDS